MSSLAPILRNRWARSKSVAAIVDMYRRGDGTDTCISLILHGIRRGGAPMLRQGTFTVLPTARTTRERESVAGLLSAVANCVVGDATRLAGALHGL